MNWPVDHSLPTAGLEVQHGWIPLIHVPEWWSGISGNWENTEYKQILRFPNVAKGWFCHHTLHGILNLTWFLFFLQSQFSLAKKTNDFTKDAYNRLFPFLLTEHPHGQQDNRVMAKSVGSEVRFPAFESCSVSHLPLIYVILDLKLNLYFLISNLGMVGFIKGTSEIGKAPRIMSETY